MKAMNFESPKWGRGALDVTVVDEAVQRRRRRNVIIALAVVAIVVVLLALMMLRGGSGKKAGPAAKAGSSQQDLPSVSVVVPGRQQVVRTISATGSIAARHDLPVGVTGEGGQGVRGPLERGPR